ncbi:MAG: arginine deiminase family protein [Firmicutes bacterium]|nr:arginine deiminase family protein [Bacillota bacterium]
MTTRTRGGTPRPDYWGIDSEYGRLTDVLVGPIDNYSWQPGNAIARRSARLGRTFDKSVVLAQYAEMISAYQSAGVRVHQLPAEHGLPYQVYARDSSVMTPWGAIIMQLQKDYRRGEYAAVLRFYLDNAIPIYDMVTAGNVEGGDFMVLKPGVAICGYSGERSIKPAVMQLKSWFEAEGWELYAYAFDAHFLHLDVQMGMISEDLAVVCVEAVDPALIEWLQSKGIRILPISYGEAMGMGTNIVALGADRVLIPAAGKKLIARCRAEGLEVFDPDVSMIAQGGGSVHCMCQALRRDPV